jgi:hypothetical protein
MHALAYVLYFASFYLAFESTATKHWTRLRIVHVLVPVQKQQASASFPSRMAKKPHSRKQHFSVALCTADFLDAIERSIHTPMYCRPEKIFS